MSNSRPFRRRRLLFVGPDLTEEQSPRIREGIVRRRLTVSEGRCPCGAELRMPEPRPGVFTHVTVEHEPGCPAGLYPDTNRKEWISHEG
jgi:hypothetical protein